ncbi:hypothetical protein [Motilibacter deserti]|uniref:Uncharacterized protein n=1 Tax=Motilibacter deserti TaxID=2714956 RepID=A0ABX0GTT4_9ACTN|nr:hypothetical protein [Motilibacter deserti]NHC13239.1 hypothetical protein [Motilibacter deserti]
MALLALLLPVLALLALVSTARLEAWMQSAPRRSPAPARREAAEAPALSPASTLSPAR